MKTVIMQRLQFKNRKEKIGLRLTEGNNVKRTVFSDFNRMHVL